MNATLPERESMEFDVVIVGAGPAGLAAAIRLKQRSPDCSVVVLEKGSETGAHILSGAVIDPVGLDALLPDWRESDCPLTQPVTEDRFHWLGPAGAMKVPQWAMPPLMHNHGNFVGSLGELCQWLGGKAEELGVDVFPGFAATEVLHDEAGSIVGVATGDMGVDKNGEPKSTFQRGMALYAKYTLIAEGARGSLAKQLIARFSLDDRSGPQKYGLGIKELWRVKPENHRPGLIQHTMGWPLDRRTGGGSFLYHYGDNLVAVGFVTHLDYTNPHLSPFQTFQAFKTHPLIASVFEDGERLSYGARALTEGGWQAVPKLTFPGGALIGCSAGFMNVPRIKGSHNAILSGMQAADATALALAAGRQHDELAGYEQGWRDSAIGRDLKPVRNIKPLWSRFGAIGGLLLGGAELWLNTLRLSAATLRHRKPDFASLEPARRTPAVSGPKPDNRTTFDRLSSVFLAGLSHDEDQPTHLRVRDPALQKSSEHDIYGGPSTNYCPAGVYEWVGEGDGLRYQINAANCVHCKTCDIKDPNQNIDWVPPEGGSGPNYRGM